MKIVYFGVVVLFLVQRQSDAGVVRKPPAFATPVYSNSYLPAAMQVIFHAVEQLKTIEADDHTEIISSSTIVIPTTSYHEPGQHQPTIAELNTQMTEASATSEVSATSLEPIISTDSTDSVDSNASAAPASSTETTTSLLISPVEDSESSPTLPQITDDTTDNRPQSVNESTATIEAETPEENYGTPEVNHEVQEVGQEVAEINEEISEVTEGTKTPKPTSSVFNSKIETTETPTTDSLSTIKMHSKTTESSENSKVFFDKYKDSDAAKLLGERRRLLGVTESFEDESKEDSNESKSLSSKEESNESKSLSSSESKESKEEEDPDSAEEEDDEIRLTLTDEKVAQVSRPSLTSYLKRTAKVPLRNSVQQLAILYDALSKDARKQGLSKFAGYSDQVLKTLESSMEDGFTSQLRTLLEKIQERNELTRDDAKSKVSATLKNLADPSSNLSRDLRRLVPLRYVP